MVDKKTRKLLLILVPIVCVLMIALSVFAYNENQDSRADASSEDLADIESFGLPRVTSLDPKGVREGEDFRYYLKVVDSDTPSSQIEVRLLEGPEWLFFSEEGWYLYGTPKFGTSDTQMVSLSINDGTNTVLHKFYILILPENE